MKKINYCGSDSHCERNMRSCYLKILRFKTKTFRSNTIIVLFSTSYPVRGGGGAGDIPIPMGAGGHPGQVFSSSQG